MPLLGTEPFTLRKGKIADDEEVFFIQFTRECFRFYREYISRIELYKKKIWTCSLSGRTNLTFEEALASEADHRAVALQYADAIPPLYIEPILHIIQHSPLRIDDLCDDIIEYFRENYVVGEIVQKTNPNKDDQQDSVKILDYIKTKKGEYKYQVLPIGNRPDAFVVVDPSALTRKKPPFTKKVLHKSIYIFAHRDPGSTSIWYVKDEYMTQYPSLPIDLPEDLAQKESERLQRKRKRGGQSRKKPLPKIVVKSNGNGKENEVEKREQVDQHNMSSEDEDGSYSEGSPRND
eukprot:TRINITY_DN12693_c0_g1_i1.p1 TRINITY_DN12693_c0_g1~~TRINITY_DN12693_c0_g1_i1.p1  ORF type:complete len:291 (-),score=83.26 TRINITY_DN12693_c0_g1_i1:66-938(-)